MPVLDLRLVLPAAILAIVFLGFDLADGISAAHGASEHPYRRAVPGYREARTGSVQAKTQYCSDCHGSSGQGYRGFFPIPRIAGQTTEYFENQLRAFIERRRETRSVINMSRTHGLGREMQAALATHFNGLDPRALGGAPRRFVDTGKTIYEAGMPDANVPACSVCHGRKAEGKGPIPRLAGQLYPYTIKELVNWDRERGEGGPDASAVMRPIAHSLTKSQIEAVAAYLSYLE